jgi:hypothetical protein
MQRYRQRACVLVDTRLGDANLTVRDEVLKCAVSNVGANLVKYKHGRQLIVIVPRRPALVTTNLNDERAANAYV